MTDGFPTNPATQKSLSLPPALVEGVQDDPELLIKLTRSQLVVLQDRMVRKVLDDKEATVGQLAVVHERLSKNANVEPKEGGLGGGAQVVINFHRHTGRDTVTIDGQAGHAAAA